MSPTFTLWQRIAGILVLPFVVAACATPPEPVDLTPPVPQIPPSWSAPIPHGGSTTQLQGWWEQFDDPGMERLIEASQAVSADLAQAQARLAQARAALVQAQAAGEPQAGVGAALVRGREVLDGPTGLRLSAAIQASWELDVRGELAAGERAAQARLAAADANWNALRVAVAAEAASQYINARACRAFERVQTLELESRSETLRLTQLGESAGLRAPADTALAQAATAVVEGGLLERQTQCAQLTNGLAVLTGLPVAELDRLFSAASVEQPLPVPRGFGVPLVPGALLRQRPDLQAAELEWFARLAEVQQADARFLPQVRVSGLLNVAQLRGAGLSVSGSTWTLGPLEITLPLADGGLRQASSDLARAQLLEAEQVFQATIRRAVGEVQDALIVLGSLEAREAQAQKAVQGLEQTLAATEARWRAGLASQFELEEIRRQALQARVQVIDLQRARLQAWISLYRALGGGWTLES